jgi:glycosyltransferase domain-containing protein
MINMSNLKRLTLVVPPFKRQDFALRLMNYWNDKGPEVIILDGSPDPIETALLSKFDPRLRYIHKPVCLYERLAIALNLVNTDYVALAGDDEFYVPSAIESCIRELDSQPSFVACCGRAIGFSYKNNLVLGVPQYSSFENYTLDLDGPEKRLIKHMRQYAPSLIYAVCKTEPWRMSFKHILKCEFSFFASGEVQFEMLMSYAGKSKVIPELMWLRSLGETEPVRGIGLSLDPAKKFQDWWGNLDKSVEREEFMLIMSQAFSEISAEAKDLKDNRTDVANGLRAYLEFEKNYQQQNPIMCLLRVGAQRAISRRFRLTIKNLIRELRGDSDMELLRRARALEASGVCVDFATLNAVELNIKAFHENRLRRN